MRHAKKESFFDAVHKILFLMGRKKNVTQYHLLHKSIQYNPTFVMEELEELHAQLVGHFYVEALKLYIIEIAPPLVDEKCRNGLDKRRREKSWTCGIYFILDLFI
jgi:hypothetical protein